VTQCGGSSEVKVKSFYDILQENGKDRIANSDKDFPENFSFMIYLATKLVNDYEPLVSKLPKEKDDSFMKELEDRKENLADDLFFEHVFADGQPILTR